MRAEGRAGRTRRSGSFGAVNRGVGVVMTVVWRDHHV